MKALVSIIIPIYKVEDYMDACVESVVNQTYKNLEIILVDDGSPDVCPAKCDEWAEKDSRIRVIHQQNRGLSGARNSGLAQCRGDYVLYVDSDDVIAKDMTEVLLSLCEERDVDFAMSTALIGDEERDSKLRHSGKIADGKSEEMFRLITRLGAWQAWGKLIKRDLAVKCPFEEKLIYEDFENTPRLILNSKRIAVSMDGRYIYTVRGDSIMGERQKATSVDFAGIVEKNLALIEKSGFSQDSKDYLYAFYFKQLVYNYNTTISNSNGGNGFVSAARRIIKENKDKFKNNKYVPKGRKIAYNMVVSFRGLYDFIYKHTHKQET